MADDQWLSPEELAEWLGIPVATIRRWRRTGDGPKSYKLGRHVRYRRSEVEAWADTRSSEEAAADVAS